MKFICRPFVLLATILLAGCDIGLVARLREQLAEPERFFEVTRDGTLCRLSFREPVIERKYFAGLGLPDGKTADNQARATYLLQLNDAGPRPVEVVFQFSQGRLTVVSMPAIFYEVLGPRNIMLILRIAGGHGLTGKGFDPITPGAVYAAFSQTQTKFDLSSRLVVIKLISTVPDTRSLALQLSRRVGEEIFRTINVSLKPQPLPEAAAPPRKL